MSMTETPELTTELMREVASLSNSVMSGRVTTVDELRNEAVHIAESNGVLAGTVYDQTWGHITRRFRDHTGKESSPAYVFLRDRNKK